MTNYIKTYMYQNQIVCVCVCVCVFSLFEVNESYVAIGDTDFGTLSALTCSNEHTFILWKKMSKF